ncbi:coxsackievirus and adenovirus receptor homolog [Girardinichthys multiradiatus]|uniref:coxsackievirus and adenovirus receptor homolog n=1 Tax=Girardinichthys multiradiatus TaxID=208333 RepID=UPI001FAB9ADB|nr:coxsackievirus and adenovirus receptor homolog [Girardinichthys multiradiatus]
MSAVMLEVQSMDSYLDSVACFRMIMFRQSCSHLRTPFNLCCPSWLLLCSAALMSTELRSTQGLTVTSTGLQTIQRAEGDTVTLGCSYTLSPLDRGEIDIEWSVLSPDTTKKNQMLLSYTRGAKYYHGGPRDAEGFSFAAGDPSKGDASLSISQLSRIHSATYQCKVRKSPGVDTRKVSLVVKVKPSVPKCRLEGGELVGEAVSLRCHSSKGSSPLKYEWRRESKDPMPAGATQDSATGELRISNHTQSFAGIYLCEVNNAVGAERCRISLRANKSPNRTAVIGGKAVGSLLLILIFLVLAGLLCWNLKDRQHHDKESSNEIRDDATPPDSCPVSWRTGRNAGQTPQTAYMWAGQNQVSTHNPSSYCQGQTPVKNALAGFDSKHRYAV